MKTRTVLFLIVIAATVSACKKDNSNTQTEGIRTYITASKDNAAWSGTALAMPYYDTIDMRGYNSNEMLQMKIRFTAVGKYILTGDKAGYTVYNGGILLKSYTIRTDTVSSVTVTSYDASTRIVEADFELKLVQSYPVSVIPAKLNFTGGKFRALKKPLED